MASPRDEGPNEDGAVLEGFSCRWDSWEAFHRALEECQASPFRKRFKSDKHISCQSEQPNALSPVEVLEKRKGARYIPDEL
ncbi:hypothetical protein PF008_g11113 [Phytophthora fragariae]|uniref:Uncharacterized protein n=1 Tax=Phytophthora fragariae TaxID=53985 RepID=A0A6G0RTB4_9STRA|nr:hypothetical protein PF008_g11113 [Phytophthora fragariae]